MLGECEACVSGRVWGSVRHVGCSGSVGMCEWEGVGSVRHVGCWGSVRHV